MQRWLPTALTVAVLALTACGGNGTDPMVSGPDGDVDCADVLTGEEGAALDWDSRTNVLDVEAVDGSCQLVYQSLGTVTVGELDGTAPARRRVEEACAALRVDEHLTADLVGGGTGCVTALDPATQTGVAELVLLTQDGSAVRITIDAKAPLDDNHVRAGLNTLVRAAQRHW